MQGALLGPSYSDAEIAQVLMNKAVTKSWRAGLADFTVDLLKAEKVVGWFQGRMEFGPRALGNRSILGDCRLPRMQSVMNLKVKFRESFRPFAPIVWRERGGELLRIGNRLSLHADRGSHQEGAAQPAPSGVRGVGPPEGRDDPPCPP